MKRQQQTTILRSKIGDLFERIVSFLQALKVVTIAREDDKQDGATSASMFLIREIEINLIALESELNAPELFQPADDHEPANDDEVS